MVESWQWYSWISMGTSAFALGLAIYLRSRHPERRAGTIFVAAMSFFLLAATFAYLMRYQFAEGEYGDLLMWSMRGFYFVHMLAVGLTGAFVGTYFYGFQIFRHRAVSRLLFVSLLAAAIFVSALVTEKTTPYGVFPDTHNSQAALVVISTVYGTLALATIGRTLLKNKDSVVRRQALVMLVGILAHGATAEVYAYLRLSGQFPPPFLTVSALAMAGAFTIAVVRFRMFGVAPAPEEPAPVPEKFPLKLGRAYLSRARTPETAFQALAEMAHRGANALVVTRQPPNAVREDFDLERTPILWLTTTAGQNHVPPTDPNLLVRLVGDFVAKAERPIVGMEGLEYLSTHVGFDAALRALQSIRDRVASCGGTLILSANPGALDEREIALVERDFEDFQAPAQAVVEDVFVIHKSGLLITHEARRMKPETDRDIMASMLTAIMNFVKISFAEGSDELRRLDLRDKTVLLDRGDKIILAVVYQGHQPEDIGAEMRAFLWRAERRFGELLERWNGDVDEVGGIRTMTARLFV